jgi:hypothetical protein
MAPEVRRDDRRPWSWTQFGIAVSLFPVSFVLWLVGLGDVFRPQHHPIAGACLIAAPFVALTGALWLVVLLVRRFTTGRGKGVVEDFRGQS